jgi:DNA-binding transcriptional LysR family regulator
LVSRAAVDSDLATGRLVALPSPETPIPRRLSLVHRGIDRLPPAAAALRRMLLDVTAGTGGSVRPTPTRRGGKRRRR